MHPPDRHMPARRLSGVTAAILTVSMYVTACHNSAATVTQIPVDQKAQVVGPRPLNAITIGRHGFAPEFLAACAGMAWTPTCDDPLYTDDQRFILDANSYGPHAYVAPSPSLPSWKSNADFASPRLAALVYVKPQQAGGGGLPDSYRALLLSPGTSCVYLQYSGNSFTAYVEPTTTPCADPYKPNPARALEVQTVRNPSPWNGGSEAAQSDNIPPVARFHEARNEAHAAYTLIGLRCGPQWCVVQPQTAVTETPSVNAGMNGAVRTWAIHGWSDAQHMALAGIGGAPAPSDLDAAIVPDPDLGSRTWKAPQPGEDPGPDQHAATILIKGKIRGIYETKWRFRHRNELYIWQDATGQWTGEIQNGWGWWRRHVRVYVEQRHPGMGQPSTARMRWSDDDEDFWVECGGCCYVTAIM